MSDPDVRRDPRPSDPVVVVLAKAPVPGRAKTRLMPPCSPESAAALAEASLADTLQSVERWAGSRLLALDPCGAEVSFPGWPTTLQPEGGLGVRLDAAFASAFGRTDGPVFLLGMDTPQVTEHDLEAAFAALADRGPDAVIGLAGDGGYWGIGFRRFVPDAFDGVEMSTAETGAQQIAQLERLGCGVALLATLDDIDTFDDAVRAGARWPHTHVGRLVATTDWWKTARPKGYFVRETDARSSA